MEKFTNSTILKGIFEIIRIVFKIQIKRLILVGINDVDTIENYKPKENFNFLIDNNNYNNPLVIDDRY